MAYETRPPGVDESGAPAHEREYADVPVLAMSGTGAVSKRKMGKTGPSMRKGRTAAKRKPDTKPPTPKKGATGKRAGKSFRTVDQAEGPWRVKAKVAGRKPSADQKKGAIKGAAAKKKTAAKRAGGTRPTAKRPAARKAAAKRATRR